MGKTMSINTIPSLDGIRAVAVLLVLFSHAGLGNMLPGGFGVTTFFFLSGYLITTLLLNEYQKNNRIDFRNFFIRRFFRLFPPLILTLVISYLLIGLDILGGGVSLEGALSQIFYLANYHSIFNWPGEVPNGTGILWSLAVEEHFYLLFPFIFFFLIRNHDVKTITILLLVSCFIVLLWRTTLIFYYEAEATRTYYATDTRIDSIIYGCILAIAFNPIYSKPVEKMNLKAYIVLLVSLSFLAFSFLYRNENFRETLRYTIQGIALAPIFYLSIRHHEHVFFRFLNTKVMKKIGVYSYFIYLIHYVVIECIREQAIVNSIAELIIFSTMISIFYAFLIDRYYDVYFRKLRKRFR
tara:strand:+ start:200 stop:1258 length:1059 start_codon:yes stop_codon:yes gene_type:complete